MVVAVAAVAAVVVPAGADLVPAAELAGLMETAHLLRSPRNARRLLSALRRAKLNQGKLTTVEKLRHEVGLSASQS